MSDVNLRRTIRRCTALLLIVLGSIAVEVASIEYSDGGEFVGFVAMGGAVLYLVVSAFVSLAEPPDRDGPDAEASDVDDDTGPSGAPTVPTEE